MVKYCQGCGNKNFDEAIVCINCSSKLEGEPTPEAQTTQPSDAKSFFQSENSKEEIPTQQPKKPKRGKVVAVIAVTAILISFASFALLYSDNSRAEAIKASTLATANGGDIASYKCSMDMTIMTVSTYGGQSATMDGTIIMTGSVDLTNRLMEMDMSMVYSGTTPIEMGSQYYLIDDEMYMYIDYLGTQQWVKMSLEEQNIPWTSYDQMGSQAQLLESASVRLLEDETINDVDCYVLEIKPDVGKLFETLMSQQNLGTSGITSSVYSSLLSDMVEELTVKMWTAKDTNYIMKMYEKITMEMNMYGSSTSMDMEMTMVLTNYNEPVTVTLPPEAVENAINYEDYLASLSQV